MVPMQESTPFQERSPSVMGPERFPRHPDAGLPLRWRLLTASLSRSSSPDRGPFAWEFPGRLLLRPTPCGLRPTSRPSHSDICLPRGIVCWPFPQRRPADRDVAEHHKGGGW